MPDISGVVDIKRRVRSFLPYRQGRTEQAWPTEVKQSGRSTRASFEKLEPDDGKLSSPVIRGI
jgi:hypothetical protein